MVHTYVHKVLFMLPDLVPSYNQTTVRKGVSQKLNVTRLSVVTQQPSIDEKSVKVWKK
jgi:hypothetical protein